MYVHLNVCRYVSLCLSVDLKVALCAKISPSHQSLVEGRGTKYIKRSAPSTRHGLRDGNAPLLPMLQTGISPEGDIEGCSAFRSLLLSASK